MIMTAPKLTPLQYFDLHKHAEAYTVAVNGLIVMVAYSEQDGIMCMWDEQKFNRVNLKEEQRREVLEEIQAIRRRRKRMSTAK